MAVCLACVRRSHSSLLRPISWLMMVWLLSNVASAEPAIVLSRSVGPPTSRILVSGSGFAPNRLDC